MPVTNKQVLEGLWGLGIDEATLARISTAGTTGQFFSRLKAAGVTDAQISGAQRLTDWRPSKDLTPGANVRSLLEAMGVDPKTYTPQGPGAGPLTYDQLLTNVSATNPQVATNLRIKLGLPVEAGLPVWNPFRGDKPAGTPPPGAPPPKGPGLIKGPTKPEPGLRPGVGVPPGGAPPGGLPPPGGGALPPGGVPPGGPTLTTTPVEKPLTPDQRRERIAATYGWASALADDPEIAKILNDVANGTISEVKADQLYKSSNFYKTFNSRAREWKIMEGTDPVDAARKKRENLGNILAIAKSMGITEPDMGRMERLNDFVLSMGMSDADVRRSLSSEMRYDPDGAKTGISAQLKNISREWLVPLSDQAMTSWVQAVAGGTKTVEEFTEYNRGMAKSMFPSLGTALDDPAITTRKYMDPYAQDTANLLGINAADIDWMDPKYMRAFNQVDPKTNQRTVMSRSDWQRTLMKDPTYKYDETTHGKQQKQALTTGLMEMFGFKFS
jgi:hypothetical protein